MKPPRSRKSLRKEMKDLKRSSTLLYCQVLCKDCRGFRLNYICPSTHRGALTLFFNGKCTLIEPSSCCFFEIGALDIFILHEVQTSIFYEDIENLFWIFVSNVKIQHENKTFFNNITLIFSFLFVCRYLSIYTVNKNIEIDYSCLILF